MHCLGAGAGGQASPSGFGSRSGILSVVRAVGVLVCEGRIQGPPRGYKEGPHCVPPLQPQPNNHVCEKDNYLCDRYLVLVREITERVSSGSYLCVEVVLCSDCPCGLVKSKSKHLVLSSPPITSWQHSSEMLLEYWCIGVVPSKSPETMNSQGLYQAVRSRLHFSQVAAWWSRTNGSRPCHIATRIVKQSSSFPGSDEHLRRFRETPAEHTFPLASVGDGNSVKVTVWALPRMEDIPHLHCPAHPQQQLQQQQQPAQPPLEQPLTTTTTTTTTTALPVLDNICEQPISNSPPARASPLEMPGKFTKTHVAPSSQAPFSSSDSCNRKPTSRPPSSNFVYYMSSFRSAALLDDRLQIPCDKPGKHHCRCADEEDEEVVLQPLPVRANGERKRRRSLPCRPQPTAVESQPAASQSPTPATETLPPLKEPPLLQPQPSPPKDSSHLLDGLERSFRTQLSIDSEQQDCCGNLEKRYKRSESSSSTTTATATTATTNSASSSSTKDGSNTHVPLLMPWIAYSANGNVVANNPSPPTPPGMNLVLNPFCSDRSALAMARTKSLEPQHLLQQQQKKVKGVADGQATANGDLNRLMSKLSFSQDKESSSATGKSEQPPGILDWISRVPGRVLGADQESQRTTTTNQQQQQQVPTKMRNCNLALSAREFDEVLAVLRARTPLGRRRTALRTAKRREKYDKLVNEHQQQQQPQTTTTCGRVTVADNVANKADVLLGAILRTTSKENASARKGLADISNGTRPRMPSKEDTVTSASETTAATTTSSCPESTGNGVTSPDGCDTSLPSALNKRLSRLTRLFKRQEQDKLTASKDNDCLSPSPSPQRTNHSQGDCRVKRRIDFSSERTGVNGAEQEEVEDEEEAEEDDDEEDEEEEEEDEDEVVESQRDSSVGTSTNSAHLNSIFHSTNYEKRNGCCSPDQPQKLKAERQRQRTECCMDGRETRTTSGKKKSRGKRDLSPIWVNHNNNHVSNNDSNINGIEPATGFEANDNETIDRTLVPSAKDQERFRRSLENAASMVFHSRTGLPLTSSPAPLRRGSCCFDFDSSLNSVSSKRSALFELNTPPSPGAVSLEEGDRETESACDIEEVTRRRSTSRNRPQSHALLGSFEESALNGRLEPVSTVHGFTAEIGASGSFCPKHRKLPVTVFFYTLGDNDKVSSPYLAHINLGKKGYQVPRSGTIQVTLSNPLGTVVKMFVVLYDLSDMPARSHTFLRQRTLRDKMLRYLIHLRFMSGKSGRIYLHTDVRMIICRKSDVDTASDFGSEPPKELRSYIHGPTNPKFSPRC